MKKQTAQQRQAFDAYSDMNALFMADDFERRRRGVAKAWAVVWAITIGIGAALIAASIIIEKYL